MLLKLLVSINRKMMGLFAWLWLLAGFPIGFALVAIFEKLASYLPDFIAEYIVSGSIIFAGLIFPIVWICVTAVIQLFVLPPARILFTIDERINNVAKRYGECHLDFSRNQALEGLDAESGGKRVPFAFKEKLTSKDIIGGVVAMVLIVIVLIFAAIQGFCSDAISRDAGDKTAKSEANDTMTDSRDGQTYRTIRVGDKIWMAENLNYNNGNGYCYDDDPYNCEKYGRLYTWNAAMVVCPSGWVLPSNNDWRQLKEYAEANSGPGNAGAALKNGGQIPFNAGLGGDRVAGKYKFLEETGYYWSSTEEDNSRAFDWVFSSNSDDLINGNIRFSLKKNAFSVRCIRNSNVGNETVENKSTMTDSRDGQSYRIVKIGKQIWMTDNLKFRTGNSTCGRGNCEKYGMYYTWTEANSGVCPKGWHLPRQEEWNELWKFAEEDQQKLVNSTESIKVVSCPYCNMGQGKPKVERIHPSNSTGFSALLNAVANWHDGEGYGSTGCFAYWNSTDEDLSQNSEEESYEFCPGPTSAVLFSSMLMEDKNSDPGNCRRGNLKRIKNKRYPVRCIKNVDEE